MFRTRVVGNIANDRSCTCERAVSIDNRVARNRAINLQHAAVDGSGTGVGIRTGGPAFRIRSWVREPPAPRA